MVGSTGPVLKNVPVCEELVILSIADNNNFESTRRNVNKRDCFNNNQRCNLLEETYV